MKTYLASVGVVLSSLLIGCASDGAIEDGENDEFMTADVKADAFGVEDWSPDGAAVLTYVSSATVAKLQDEVGLSERVAKAIVAQRNTLPGKKFKDLADLDAAKYVGTTVFKELLHHAAEAHLFKTALRIPLVVEGNSRVSITSYNDEARTAGVAGFAKYTFVDASTDYTAKMATYDTRLQAIATKLNLQIDGEMAAYASSVNDYAVGSLKPCFIGDPLEVADVTSSQADNLMGDMYSLWGWRYKTKKWIYEDQDESEMNFGTDWTSFKKTGKSVLLMATNTDDGGDPIADEIPPCR
ncbi:MAG: hypothetical protein IPQ07_34215 [Myxococcales bacterium]|nr:hypothetical protein [Myxococcales bacterium]